MSAAAVPQQLVDAGCRFIRVQEREKKAIDRDWQTKHNYGADDKFLLNHLRRGGNYGVMCGPETIIIDCDDAKLHPYIEPFRDSFTVTSSGNGKMHLYLRCPDAPREKFILHDPTTGEAIGDVRGPNTPFYVVGPGSTHPSGAVYTATGASVQEVSWRAVETALGPTMRRKQNPAHEPNPRSSRKTTNDVGELIEDWRERVLHRLPPHEERPPNEKYRRRYSLQCPFDTTHDNNSAFFGQLVDGPFTAGCLHDSCTWGWAEFRDLYEPERRTKPLANLDSGKTLTDTGNANRLVSLFGNDLRYCGEENAWYIWNGRHWEEDKTLKVMHHADEVVRSLYREAADEDDEKDRKNIASWAKRSESVRSRKDMIEAAKHLLPATIQTWDANPKLFNVQNGTIELETLTFREHRREDYLTKLAGVEYDPAATCQVWEDHLRLIFNNNTELINGFQMLVGYAILPGNEAQVINIAYGSGKNGKSKTLGAIEFVFGDYYRSASPTTFMTRRQGSASEDLARLHNARFVTSYEPEKGAKLAENVIKQISGGDTITARHLYKASFEFKMQLNLWISTNHRPVIEGTDEAIWRRILLWPFDVTIPEDRRDTLIHEKFEKEGAGILNWALEGLRRFYANGRKLIIPEAVRQATEAYRGEQDVLGEFLDDCCDLGPSDNPDYVVSRAELYFTYTAWCENNGETALTKKEFATALRGRGVTDGKRRANERRWAGIRWKCVKLEVCDT